MDVTTTHTAGPDAAARLLDHLDRRIPAEASVLEEPDGACVFWSPYANAAGERMTWYVVIAGSGVPTVIGRVDAMPPRALSLAGVRAMSEGLDNHPETVLREPVRNDSPSPDGPRRRTLALAVAGLDVPALSAAADGVLCSTLSLAWLDSAIPHSGAAQAVARAHPWLVPAAARTCPADARKASRLSGPDAAAALALSRLAEGAGGDPAAVVARLRGLAHPETLGEVGPYHARALLAMPTDLFPPPLPSGASLDGMQGHLAFVTLAPTLHALAGASGRDIRSVLGPARDWSALGESMARRAGLQDGPADFPGEWGVVLVADTVAHVADMVRAFAREMLAPALLRAGEPMRMRPDPSTRLPLHEAIVEDPVVAAAAGLLLGNGTLPALAETAGRWSGRSDAIARLVAGLVGGTVRPGPRAFRDVDLPEGHYLTCLTTVSELLDEGAPGADASGAAGLDHCVGGYGEAVTQGMVAIVSLRRRLPDGGYERVSTAEVDFHSDSPSSFPYIVQHRGRRNAEPPGKAKMLLNHALRQVRGEAAKAMRDFTPPDGGWPDATAILSEPHNWERMRGLWSFALTRPQRAMGPAELLHAAGIERP